MFWKSPLRTSSYIWLGKLWTREAHYCGLKNNGYFSLRISSCLLTSRTLVFVTCEDALARNNGGRIQIQTIRLLAEFECCNFQVFTFYIQTTLICTPSLYTKFESVIKCDRSIFHDISSITDSYTKQIRHANICVIETDGDNQKSLGSNSRWQTCRGYGYHEGPT